MKDSLQPGVFTVAIIGAGPAGLFAARELATKGVRVLLFNRDIKPGGLAEFGIYPTKFKMKEGLRHQFRQILDLPNIHYFGNVRVGEDSDLSIQELQNVGIHAILVTVGAQGTKWLGLPGEDLVGVYHAKDLVYHYNHLPPFGQSKYAIGKRVALVGVGNVMVDIARWLTHEVDVDEVTIIARRGPAQTKFDHTQLQHVFSNLDLDDLESEFERVAHVMRDIGEDPEDAKFNIISVSQKADPKEKNTRVMMRFLKSPFEIIGDNMGNVKSIVLEDTTLDILDGIVSARKLGTYSTLQVDTVIFAIGDRVEKNLGLPVKSNEFVLSSTPRFPIANHSFEVQDNSNGKVVDNLFVAGWSRNASSGLVGLARKDGVNGALAIFQYLETLNPATPFEIEKMDVLCKKIRHKVVKKEELRRLEAIEKIEAEKRGWEEFKFDTNEEMLEVIGLISTSMH